MKEIINTKLVSKGKEISKLVNPAANDANKIYIFTCD